MTSASYLEGMAHILILIAPCNLSYWLKSNEADIHWVQLGTQKGAFTDGRRFIYRVTEGDWLERLRGLRISEFKTTEGVRLNSFETSALQAMMQMS